MGVDKCYFKLRNMSEFNVKYTAILNFGFNYTDVDNVYYDLTLRSYKGYSSAFCNFKMNLKSGDRVFVYDMFEAFSCYDSFFYFVLNCFKLGIDAYFVKQRMVASSFNISTDKGRENLTSASRLFKERNKKYDDVLSNTKDYPLNFAKIANSLQQSETGALPKDYRRLTGLSSMELMQFYEVLCS